MTFPHFFLGDMEEECWCRLICRCASHTF